MDGLFANCGIKLTNKKGWNRCSNQSKDKFLRKLQLIIKILNKNELNGVNRIEDFIQQAELRGWLVNRL